MCSIPTWLTMCLVLVLLVPRLAVPQEAQQIVAPPMFQTEPAPVSPAWQARCPSPTSLPLGWSASSFHLLSCTVPHFGGRLVEAHQLSLGGHPWGTFVTPTAATGFAAPQLYITAPDTPGAPNWWGAPFLMNMGTTHTGNNRALAILLGDDSTEGPLGVTGIEVQIASPADRGGDTSGIYVRQSGGGNALSVFHLQTTGLPGGYGIEAQADGTAGAVFAGSVNGPAFLGIVRGPDGTGVNIQPTSEVPSRTRAVRVATADNTAEQFFVQMDGTMFVRGNVLLGGSVTMVQTAPVGTGDRALCLSPAGEMHVAVGPTCGE